MKFLQKWLTSRRQPPEESADLLSTANRVGGQANKLAWDTFSTFRSELLAEPLTFIVPAIWGASKEGELTPLQKQIYSQTCVRIDEIYATLQMEHLTEAQEFAVKYLIRDLVISKIVYMIEAFRIRLDETLLQDQRVSDYLKNIEPKGSA